MANVPQRTKRPQTAVSVNLNGVTVEQALQQILSVNQLAYKVMSERSVLIFPDTAPKHAQYDEQVIQTFYVSHADVTELNVVFSEPIDPATLPVGMRASEVKLMPPIYAPPTS